MKVFYYTLRPINFSLVRCLWSLPTLLWTDRPNFRKPNGNNGGYFSSLTQLALRWSYIFGASLQNVFPGY